MPLTPEQFATVQSTHEQATAVSIAAADLVTMLSRVVAKADPDDPLNVDMTLARLSELQGPEYLAMKNDLQAKIDELP